LSHAACRSINKLVLLTDKIIYILETIEFSSYVYWNFSDVIGLMLYLLYTADFPVASGSTIAIYADDRAIFVAYEIMDYYIYGYMDYFYK
jgi:hypothetical protein